MNNIEFIIEHTKNIDVLYVEDNKEIQESTKDILDIYFKSVDTAIDGKEGLSKYLSYKEEHDFYYDLVITDINMPKMNGLDMCQEIIKLNEIQAIIVITAYDELVYLHQAIEIGVDGYIPKPIDNKQLSRVIYKTARAISDHKYVESHVKLMENMNLQLEAKNEELFQKNIELEKSSRILDTVIHKEQILNINELNTSTVSQEKLLEEYTRFIEEDLFEVDEILNAIDLSIMEVMDTDDFISKDIRNTLGNLFARYANIIYQYHIFGDLYSVMNRFSKLLVSINGFKASNLKDIFSLLESVVFALDSWNKELNKDNLEFHHFDNSIVEDFNNIIKVMES